MFDEETPENIRSPCWSIKMVIFLSGCPFSDILYQPRRWSNIFGDTNPCGAINWNEMEEVHIPFEISQPWAKGFKGVSVNEQQERNTSIAWSMQWFNQRSSIPSTSNGSSIPAPVHISWLLVTSCYIMLHPQLHTQACDFIAQCFTMLGSLIWTLEGISDMMWYALYELKDVSRDPMVANG